MSMCKNYNLTPDYVLNMSYTNIVMYSSVLPSYGEKEEEISEKDVRYNEELNKLF